MGGNRLDELFSSLRGNSVARDWDDKTWELFKKDFGTQTNLAKFIRRSKLVDSWKKLDEVALDRPS